MTREEIREGILKDYTKLLGDLGITKTVDLTPYITSTVQRLHSQGLAIKVDRELPLSFADRGLPLMAAKAAQQAMLKAGYVAVEPLIKESDE